MAKYIEREALIADVDAAVDNNGMGYVIGQTLKRYVKRQPAADVAPVVHGRWIEKEEPYFDVIYVCSACGEEFCFIEGNPSDNLYKYCPNCGARMDGDG